MSLTSISLICCFAFTVTVGVGCYCLRKDKIPASTDKWIMPLFYSLLVLGGVLRILVASLIEGYPSDIACFKGWSEAAFSKGLSNFYSHEMYVDYPPAYIYILYLIGFVKKVFALGYDSKAFLILIKLPAILADILSSVVIFRTARRISLPTAFLLAMMYLFNPAVFFDSTVYGQIDSFLTLFILLAFLALYKENFIAASVIFVVAVLVKPQSLIFAPVMLFEFIRNVLKTKSLKILIMSLFCATAVFFIIVFPFFLKLNVFQIITLYRKTLSSYPYATLNAFNLFAFLGGNGVDQDKILFVFSFKWWGYLFLTAAVAFTAYIYCTGRHTSKLFYTACVLAAAFFVLGVRVHERYLFPIIGALLLVYIYSADKRFLYLFAGFSLTAFLNQALLMDMVLTKKSFWFLPDDMIMKAISLANVGLLVYLVKVGIGLYEKQKEN